MKRWLIAVVLVWAPVHIAMAESPLTGCATKEHDIMSKIENARQRNNLHRVQGLKQALQQVREHCTEESLYREQLSDVHDKELEVAQRIQDLEEAKASGDAEKIEKRMQKLTQARKELAQSMTELSH